MSNGPGVQPSGRLELTWTNKNLRLLAHEDGSYEWTQPSDHRVAEVRLLNDVVAHGLIAPAARRTDDNLLIRGDALHALTSLTALPEFAGNYVGHVKLAYIDPPFNTRQAFGEHYDDSLEHSVWLTMMRDRLSQIRDLLAQDGSVWVHCDDSEQHRLRCALDEIMGANNFMATVIWEKRYSRSNDAAFSVSHDYIHVYAKNRPDFARSRNRLNRPPEQERQYRNPDEDPDGPWRGIPLDAPGVRGESLSYPIVTPSGSVKRPPRGRHWSITQEKWDEVVASGRAYFGLKGDGAPNIKRYLSEMPGLVPNTFWTHEEVGHNDEAIKEIQKMFSDLSPFPTPKPERLLRRIIGIATDPGDVVLDCFAGSGTTAAVAHKMKRRWITVEWSRDTVENFTLPRLRKVVDGEDPGGVTEAEGWDGGGGFRVVDVHPSMFAVDDGRVVLADWAVGGALAEAVSAQVGFTFEDDAPFCGRKGRQRLAVVDGLVNEDVARLLLSWLGDRELLTVYGTAIDPEVRKVLAAERRGSTVKRIPQSVLDEYRRKSRIDRMWLTLVSAEHESAG